MGIVERRLSDLDRTVQRQAVDERAVAALLKGVDDVAAQAAGLSGPQREELAARLQEQAQHLERLGEAAGTDCAPGVAAGGCAAGAADSGPDVAA